MPGVATAQLLSYATVVDVSMDQTNDVNLADAEDYGHRVQIEVPKGPLNNYLQWRRTNGQARPVAALNTLTENAFKNAISEALGTTYVDIDGVNGGLHFGSALLSTNPDPRIRKDAAISANDLPLAYLMYKLYGSSAAPTLDKIYNLADAYGMLSNVSVATAIVESLKASEGGAVDLMFRDLLASDPKRFFTEDGVSEPGLFETKTDITSGGTWKLTEGDVLEIKLKLMFQSKVSRRGVAGREINVSALSSYPDNQQIVINPGDYFYVRLQMKLVSGIPTADPTKIAYQAGSNNTVVVGYSGNLVGELTIPDGVTRIADWAFADRWGLVKINLPSTLTHIGTAAFRSSGITSITVGAGVTLGEYVFNGSKLVTADLSNMTITGFGYGMFMDCRDLLTLKLPRTLTSLGRQSLRLAWSMTKLENTANITYIGEGAMEACLGMTTLNFPALTTIDSYGFAGCYNLTSFTAPLVTSIGYRSFGWGGGRQVIRPTFPLLPNPPANAFEQFY
jgi:hypothetical protein